MNALKETAVMGRRDILRGDDESDVIDDYGRPLAPVRPDMDAVICRGPGRRDTIGHSSIQPWSAGPLFPAVIAQIERYETHEGYVRRKADAREWIALNSEQFYAQPLDRRLLSTSFELTIGAFREEYATHADAEEVARYVCQDGRINPARYREILGREEDLPDTEYDRGPFVDAMGVT